MTEQKKIKVLVVDDSAFMRTAIERMLISDPSIELVGSAANGREAVEKVVRLRPDVVTESDRRAEFQAVAPETEAGLYLVPKVIE